MWVTPGASTDSTCSSFASPTFSNSRAPPPSRIGTTETTISSSNPAARYCCATDAPPPRDTSFSTAAARACSSADSIPSVTKWNVVPPCSSSGRRGWFVSTKTGWWNGGLSPHQPCQDSSHGPGPPPNMFRPMMLAPAPPRISSANGVLALTSPPCSPWLSRNALSGTSQLWSSSPPIPSGCSADCSGPATKPSIDIVMFSFNLLIDPPSVAMLVGPPSAAEVIGHAASAAPPARRAGVSKPYLAGTRLRNRAGLPAVAARARVVARELRLRLVMRPHRDGDDEERLRRGAVVGARRIRVEREERLRSALARDQILQNAVEARVHARERACTAGVRLDELEPERPGADALRRPLAAKRRADLDRAPVLETDRPAAEVPPE